MDTAAQEPMYGWNAIPWKAVERNVFKLQKRIYRASLRGDVKAVHKLQRLLTRSRSAKFLAVRRVTQDNRGKKTAGIDGVKSLTPDQRLDEVQALHLDGKAQPVRRVWIPKPGKDELRGLGIPTIRERERQTLVKLALDPEWEAKFEPNSYGFRPGRSCWDAIGMIFIAMCKKPRYTLDADIAKCFDRIDQSALLTKLHQSPTIRRQIKAWLKAGVLDGGELFPTEEGTPQGGPLSCVLANVALHGLETLVKEAFPRTSTRPNPPIVVRLADDFVVLHDDRAVVEESQKLISSWLAEMGLELKPSKTRITHTLERECGEPGFDFLGFTIRQYPVGKTKTGYDSHGKPLGFKTIITPSKEARKRHAEKLRQIVDEHKSASQVELIEALNPVIRGWANYYSKVCSTETFGELDHLLYLKLRAWALSRHPNKGQAWAVAKYWRLNEGEGWSFGPPNSPLRLYRHRETRITRHTKVQGSRSPYDGDWAYWSTRTGKYPGVTTRVATLLKRQKGQCLWCGLLFREEDVREVDHIIPTSLGGKDAYLNWQLLHRHCHDIKTANDLAEMRRTQELVAEIGGMNGNAPNC